MTVFKVVWNVVSAAALALFCQSLYKSGKEDGTFEERDRCTKIMDSCIEEIKRRSEQANDGGTKEEEVTDETDEPEKTDE